MLVARDNKGGPRGGGTNTMVLNVGRLQLGVAIWGILHHDGDGLGAR